MASTGPVQPPETLPVFAIFEGGGAKGLTHVGALKAMEAARLQLIGVAGASAGSIIAALAAVGMRADKIFDPRPGGSDVFRDHDGEPTALMGDADWLQFGKLRRYAWKRLALVIGLILIVPLVVAALAPGWSWLPLAVTVALGTLLFLVVRFGLPKGIHRLLREFGFFDTEAASAFVNRVLRKAITPIYAEMGRSVPDLVRFCDIDPAISSQFVPLKIIVTDLGARGPRLFGSATPEAVVADVVVASFSIPFFFRPAAIREPGDDDGSHRIYADGGLVSNLPSWVFSEEKRDVERARAMANPADNRPVRIITLSLDDDPRAAGPPPKRTLVSHSVDILRTGIFGSQLSQRALVQDRFDVAMVSPLSVLGFDCDRTAAIAAYKAGLDSASDRLRSDLRNKPYAARVALSEFRHAAIDFSGRRRADAGLTALSNLRASIFVPLGTRFRLLAASGMDADADDRLTLDNRSPGVPVVFRLKDLLYLPLKSTDAPPLFMTKYERALIRSELEAIIVIPIFEDEGEWAKIPEARAAPVAALCVDSDMALDFEYDDGEFMTWAVEQSIFIEPVVSAIVDKEHSV